MELIKIIYDKKTWIQFYKEEKMLPDVPEDGIWSAEGLPVIIYVKDEIIMGKFKREKENSYIWLWEGENCFGLYLLFSELLKSIAYLISGGDENYIIYKEHDFKGKNTNLSIYCTLGAMYSNYVFELDDGKDELIIHYYNSVARTSGKVSVPFKPFIKEVFNKYIDEFLEIHRILWSGDKESYQILINLINDIKRFYKERYGEELEFKIPE